MGKPARTHHTRVAVIGLGRFGAALARELVTHGSEVLAIDSNPQLVQQYSSELTHAAVADTTDAEALKQLGVPGFPHAVVGIGSNLEASILTTSLLADFKIPKSGPKPPAASTGSSSNASAPITSSCPNTTWASG